MHIDIVVTLSLLFQDESCKEVWFYNHQLILNKINFLSFGMVDKIKLERSGIVTLV